MVIDASALGFLALVGLVAAQRLTELVIAKRNTREALARGGVEVGAAHYPAMVALHTTFLVAAPLEVVIFDRPFQPILASAMLAVLVGASSLRAWVIRTLGWRWTTRVICIPNAPLVTSGPYRFVKHPNYVAVAAEIAALPLVHGAWATAIVFSGLNAALLFVRIRTEEKGLDRISMRGTTAERA
jgi:methyltransferase